MQQAMHAETMREIAGKLWRCPINRIREGMRESKINGLTKVMMVKTPAGLMTVTFITSPHKIGIMIRGKSSDYFFFEIPQEKFVLDENQGKELNSIATMSCNWGF